MLNQKINRTQYNSIYNFNLLRNIFVKNANIFLNMLIYVVNTVKSNDIIFIIFSVLIFTYNYCVLYKEITI